MMRWSVVRSPGAVGRRFRSVVASVVQEAQDGGESADVSAARPYSEVPGPKPIPLLGNSWRFIPYVGTYRISEVDKISKSLYEQYGRIAKIEGLLGRPDLVFVFDPREIERVMRAEEEMPHRPAMPSLHHYKHVLRADFFAGDNAGLISVHGENWHRFRTRVQQPLLQPRVARKFITPIDFTATEFVQKVKGLRDENLEVPGDFLDEVHKWALESITRVVLGVRLGCLGAEHEEARQMINAVLTFFQNVGHLELRVPVWRLFNTPTLNKYIRALDVIKDTTLKNVGVAMKEWEGSGGGGGGGGDPYAWREGDSLLRHVFTQTEDIKAASVLAVDMLLVGVDSVHLRGGGVHHVPAESAPRQAGDALPRVEAGAAISRHADHQRACGPHAIPKGGNQRTYENETRGDWQRKDGHQGHRHLRIRGPQREASGVPALRGEQLGGELPAAGAVPSGAVAQGGGCGCRVPLVQPPRRPPLRLAALRLRASNVRRAPIRRAGDPSAARQDGAHIQDRVPSRAVGVQHPAHVHARRTAKLQADREKGVSS